MLTHEQSEPQAQPDEPVAIPATRRSDRWWTIGLVALLVLPLVISAIYLWFAVGDAYLPTVDWAIFEMQTRDVFTHGVFVGAYSRYGFNHPGPLMFYALAVPYKLLGSKSITMHITALGINAATIAAIGWVAWRRGRLPIVLTVLVPVALMTHALGADLLRNPWNPYLPVLPLLLLLLLAWSVAVGDLWMLPVVIGVASFTIQSHVGLALESVALLLVALVGIAVQARRTPAEERRGWWRRLGKVGAVAVGVFVVLWLPVAYGTIIDDDGNLGKLLDFFTQGRETAGFHTALQVMGLQWGPRPEWILGPRGNAVFGNTFVEPRWWAVIWLVLGAAATVIALKRRKTDARARETVWLAGLIVVGLLAAILAVSNIVGVVFPYLNRWTWVLGAALGMLVLQGVWYAIPIARRAGVLRVATPLAVLLLAVIGTMETVDAINAGTPFAYIQTQERILTRQVLEHLPRGKGPVLINAYQGGMIAPGIALALERHGIPVELIPSLPVIYGDHRSDHGPPHRAKIVVVSGHESIAKFQPPGPRIAHYSRGLSDADRESLRKIQDIANRTPPGPQRDALLDLVRQGRAGPAVDVSVYLDPRPD